MSPLPNPIRELHRDPVDEVAVQRMWRGVVARRARRAPTRKVVLLVAAAIVAVALALFVRFPVATGPLTLATGGEIVELRGKDDQAPVAFSDGSWVTLESGARLVALESSGTRFSTQLVQGRAAFRVEPGGPRRWVIECGIATVEVVGTRFTVDRSARRVVVEVSEGVVLVRGETVPDHVQKLVAGRVLEIDAEGARAEVAPRVSASSEARTGSSSGALATSSSSEPVDPGAPPPAPRAGAWRELAKHGDYKGAYEALGQPGIAGQTKSSSVDELLDLADVARLSGHPAEAVAPLQEIIDAHPGDGRAALAAFTLGRVALDSTGQPARAASAFARALALGLPASLREDAEARLVEAHSRAGNRAAARAAADDYAQRYPTGRHLASTRQWVDGPGERRPGGDAGL